MYLSTEEPAASRMLEPFGEVAEMFLNTCHREHILLKLKIKELLRKISSKNLTTKVQSYSDGSVLRAIRVRQATSICYDALMKNCFKDWSQSI